MKKPKNQIFQELKEVKFSPYKFILDEAENLRELRSALAYNYSKYTCFERQSSERKMFLGEVYFPSEETIKRRLYVLEILAEQFGYNLERLTW
jgi:hypothetical protein